MQDKNLMTIKLLYLCKRLKSKKIDFAFDFYLSYGIIVSCELDVALKNKPNDNHSIS